MRAYVYGKSFNNPFNIQTQDETEEKKTLQEVNHILLRNILPEHVANHFIKVGQSDTVRLLQGG